MTKLFQETWRRRPFWMLVGCVLVNRTQWKTAQPVHARLVAKYKSAMGLACASKGDVYRIVKGLGLGRQRTETLIALGIDYSCTRYSGLKITSGRVARWMGLGQYAADSWDIFIEGHRPRGVTDKKLLAYLKEHPLPWKRSIYRDTQEIIRELREC